MKLVFVNNENHSNTPNILKYMEKNTEFCNKVLNELTEPIVKNSNCIYLDLNYFDFMNLVNLTNFLKSNKPKEIFETIQKDLKENKKEVAILNNMPTSKVENSLYLALQSDNFSYFLTMIDNKSNNRTHLKEQKKGEYTYEQFEHYR